MSFIGKIFRNSVHSGGSLTDVSDFWYGITGSKTKSGISINEENAIKYLALFACISLISGDIAKLPKLLMQKMPDGSKKRIIDEPLADIIKTVANPNTTSFNFFEIEQASLLLSGNAYSEKKRNSYTGELKALVQIPFKVTPGKDRRGIFYKWNDENGKPKKKYKKDIFHVPGFGFNGLVGKSMIEIARENIGLGRAAEDYGSLFFGQGVNPSGFFETDKPLGDNKDGFKKDLETKYARLGNSLKAMVLPPGVKYSRLSIPPNDAQFLETRMFQKKEICGMYKVPPHKIAIHDQNSNRNNLEQENAGYVDTCLMPWIVRWEQNADMQLLTQEQRLKGYYIKFQVNALLRGDSQARAEYYQTMFNTGAFSPNMILEKEDINPIEGGDQHFVQLSYVPLDMAGDFAKEKTETNTETKSMVELKEYRAKNSIQLRDRVARQYYPLFQRAVSDIVNRESVAVKKQVKKQQKDRANESMQKWLDSFYSSFPEYVRSKIGPVIRSFSEAIQAAGAQEMGVDVGMTEDLEKFVRDYENDYATRYTSGSLGQLTSELDAGLDALVVRVDEWEEKRPEKEATNETVRNSSAIYQQVAFAVGITTVLRNRGPKTCPFCRSLNGKTVSRGGGPLVKDGQELEGKDSDDPPMLIRGNKFHTPIHQKCDCYMSVI